MSKHREQIIAAAKGKVEQEILGATFAKPRGSTTTAVGGGVISTEIGARWAGKQRNGALAVTPTNLLTMSVSVSFGGQVKEVNEILSTVPLADVDSIEVKRVGLAGVMEITSGGSSFKLEGKVNDMREFVEAFERAKMAA